MPAVAQSVLSVLRPLSFAAACRRRYGPIFTLRVHPVGRVVCVADGALVRDLVAADPEVFRAGVANSIMDFVVGPRSLLLLDGAEHGRMRRVLLPPFRMQNVRNQSDAIRRIAADAVREWPVGQEFALLPRLQDIMLEIMMRSVFGIVGDAELAGLRESLPHLLHMNPALLLYPFLRRDWGRRSPGGRLARLQVRVDDILLGEIAQRRRDPDADQYTDVLSLLLAARDDDGVGLDDQTLRDHLVTLLAVGHETTATSLAWCSDLLLRHPEVQAKLRAEVATGAAGSSYVDAVLKESLRVRPVVGDVARTLAAPARIGGYHIPAGTMVALSLALTHMEADVYPQPEAFRPERFLGQPAPTPFLPFGGGPHRCLGASLAMTAMRSVVEVVHGPPALWLARPEAEERVRATGPVLTPSSGVRVFLDQRYPELVEAPVRYSSQQLPGGRP